MVHALHFGRDVREGRQGGTSGIVINEGELFVFLNPVKRVIVSISKDEMTLLFVLAAPALKFLDYNVWHRKFLEVLLLHNFSGLKAEKFVCALKVVSRTKASGVAGPVFHCVSFVGIGLIIDDTVGPKL